MTNDLFDNYYYNSSVQVPLSTFFILEVQYTPSNNNFTFYVNGSSGGSYTLTYNIRQNDTTTNYIGYSNDSGTAFNGNMSEILIYQNDCLANADRQNVEGYLAWKYNLQSNLPPSHPYYSSSPNISAPLFVGKTN